MNVKKMRLIYAGIILVSVVIIGGSLYKFYENMGGFDKPELFELAPSSRTIVGKHFKTKAHHLIDDHFRKCQELILNGQIDGDLTVINYQSDSLDTKELEQFIGIAIKQDMAEVPVDFDIREFETGKRYVYFLSMHPAVRKPSDVWEAKLKARAEENGNSLEQFFVEIYYPDNSMSIEAWATIKEEVVEMDEQENYPLVDSSASHFLYVASKDTSDQIGIGIYSWTPRIGQLQLQGYDSTSTAAFYLAVDTIAGRLYSFNDKQISSFQIDGSEGTLEVLNHVALTGDGPCYLSLSKDRKFLMVAYYLSGNVCTYELLGNGAIGAIISNFQHEGSSINESRQEAPHPHMIVQVSGSDLILVPDLGTDEVVVYRIDSLGQLSFHSSAAIKPGGGPRHLVIHPSGDFVYVLHELTGHVTGFKFDKDKGFGDAIQTLSTLPEDFEEYNKSADIHITSNGRYLYASNRGHNSIAIFEIDPKSGQMTQIDILDCGGDWPRAFAIDPAGEYLLIANKRSNQVAVMKVDTETGLFEKVGEVSTPGEPQGLRFLRKWN